MATPERGSEGRFEASGAHALAVARRRLDEERALADARRARVVPRLRAAVAAARQDGTLDGRAWLIGSYAWGEPTGASDVDLLVERCADPHAASARLEDAVGLPVDVMPVASADPELLPHLTREGTPL